MKTMQIMKRTLLTPTLAIFSAIALSGAPAFAADQHQRRSEGSRAQSAGDNGGSHDGHADGDRGRAVERAAPRITEERAVPRAAAPQYDRRVESRNDERRVESRNGWDRRVDQRGGWDRHDRPVVVAPRVVAPRVYRPYVVRPYYGPAPYFSRPYYRPYYRGSYVFRPHFSVGLGFFLGYPVPYAYAYPYPVPVYGYLAPSYPVAVGPNSTQYGGVSLEVTPEDGSVYVDGGYAGLVRDFDGTRQTLTLVTGRHHIEVSAPGYETMAFDVDIVPGQIIPCRGDLERY